MMPEPQISEARATCRVFANAYDAIGDGVGDRSSGCRAAFRCRNARGVAARYKGHRRGISGARPHLRGEQALGGLLPNVSSMSISSVTRSLSAEHLEPWNGNIVEVTMKDGSRQVGLLQRVDSNWVRLKATPALPAGGLVEIALTTAVARASRN
jgi:hypothetical protein